MKINEPLTDEQREQEDEQHRKSADSKKAFLNEVASLIEAGEPLSSWQRKWAAAAILAFSASIPLERKRRAGGKTRIPDEAWIWYADWINEGLSENKAMERIAEKYQVSMTAVKNKMGKAGTEAEKLIAREGVEEAFGMRGGRKR